MAAISLTTPVIPGELIGPKGATALEVVEAGPHTLLVTFSNGVRPDTGAEFSALRLRVQDREIELGPCRYERHPPHPMRRRNDLTQPPPGSDGRIIFLEELYDFGTLFRKGTVLGLKKRLEQLPILWSRKEAIRPAFKEFTAELLYDIQIYRTVFDEIDRNLSAEPPAIRDQLRRLVTESEYPGFCALFDRKLGELEAQVKDFNKEENERHGFYFRRHVWDIILSSEFLARTNLKPRGYSGDSVIMRMLYENDFRGTSIFGRFVHRHPIETAAAQAVRNRLALLTDRIRELSKKEPAGRPMRIMSVACGPAWEVKQLLTSREDSGRFEFTLLDQDSKALAEARESITRSEVELGALVRVSLVRDSVRTMLRTEDLSQRWGKFSFLYSMGLFDYLTTPVGKAVLGKLYGLLRPGGEMIVGNFHVGNPTRVYMEYWMDWVLFYRTEEELMALAEGLPGAEASIFFEATKSQMFLHITRKE